MRRRRVRFAFSLFVSRRTREFHAKAQSILNAGTIGLTGEHGTDGLPLKVLLALTLSSSAQPFPVFLFFLLSVCSEGEVANLEMRHGDTAVQVSVVLGTFIRKQMIKF